MKRKGTWYARAIADERGWLDTYERLGQEGLAELSRQRIAYLENKIALMHERTFGNRLESTDDMIDALLEWRPEYERN